MKIPKFLTSCCLVVCCLFTANVWGQCQVAINTSISAEIGFCGSGVSASEAQIGDTIVYTVGVSTDLDYCPIENATASLTLPDGTVIPVPIPSSLPPGYDSDDDLIGICIASYVVQEANLGQLAVDISPGNTDPTLPNEVRALVTASGTAILGPNPGETDEATGAAVRTTRILATPCVDVTKDACDYSKVWDPPETITYDITIENCTPGIGDPAFGADIQITAVDDSILGDVLADFIAANGGSDVINWGDPPVTFQVAYQPVPADEPGPIVNTVTVDANDVGTGETIPQVEDSATVILLHPEFTIDVSCVAGDVVNGDQRFEVEFCNTGDVPLNITPNEIPGDPSLQPLDAGECTILEVFVPLTGGGSGECGFGGGTATLQVSADATIPSEFCDLPNVLTRQSNEATCGTPPCDPDFTVTKECLTSPWNDGAGPCDLQPGDVAQYQIIITNTSTGECDDPIELFFLVNDPQLGIVDQLVGPVIRGESSAPIIGQEVVPQCPVDATGEIAMDENVVTVEAFCADGSPINGGQAKTASATCCYSCNPGEGCTPGFWKNHPDCWCEAYIGDPLVTSVWTALQDPNYLALDDDDRKWDLDTDTLSDALRYRGGPGLAGSVRNMLRHATAALLNGCSDDVFYPVSDTMVIDLVNLALASEDIGAIQDLHMILAGYNEDYPCPINAHCERQEPTPE